MCLFQFFVLGSNLGGFVEFGTRVEERDLVLVLVRGWVLGVQLLLSCSAQPTKHM